MALLFAAIVGALAALTKPRWDTGDLAVGLYFGAASLLSWARAVQIRRSKRSHRSIPALVIAAALMIGGTLVLLDVITAGGA